MQRALEANADNIIFLDPIPKRMLPAVMEGADIGLQILQDVPAFYNGTSPNKFFDYISAGLPVLNNYPGWIARLISEEECGFSVVPNDPLAFADKMVFASENRHVLKNYGFKGTAVGRKNLTENSSLKCG